jgi:hypothetical protein
MIFFDIFLHYVKYTFVFIMKIELNGLMKFCYGFGRGCCVAVCNDSLN